MIAHLDDLCLWVYVLVDDMCQALEGHLRRPGPKPVCSDIELIAICLMSAPNYLQIKKLAFPN